MRGIPDIYDIKMLGWDEVCMTAEENCNDHEFG